MIISVSITMATFVIVSYLQLVFCDLNATLYLSSFHDQINAHL